MIAVDVDAAIMHAVDALCAQLNLAAEFEEAWRGNIEEDWQRQLWPTFKDMARDIFEHGFRVALDGMVSPAVTFSAGATDGPAGAGTAE